LLSALPAKEIAITNIQMLFPGNPSSFSSLITIPEGLSYLTMIMLFIPCSATLSVVRKEGGSKIF
jgi:Fe2+ transport system protein B